MRPIDADALIARLEDDARHMEMPIAQMYTYGAINDIQKEPTVAVVPQWIPVTERLPEIRQEVLLCDGLWYFIAEYRGEVWYIDGVFKNSEDLDYDGFAWMPLPEPYKEV